MLIDSLSTDKIQTLVPLFCRLADLGGPGCSAPWDGLTWPLLGLGEAASALSRRLVPDALGLVLAGGADSRFELLPQRSEGSGSVTALGLRLSGASEAAADFSLPIKLARLQQLSPQNAVTH